MRPFRPKAASSAVACPPSELPGLTRRAVLAGTAVVAFAAIQLSPDSASATSNSASANAYVLDATLDAQFFDRNFTRSVTWPVAQRVAVEGTAVARVLLTYHADPRVLDFSERAVVKTGVRVSTLIPRSRAATERDASTVFEFANVDGDDVALVAFTPLRIANRFPEDLIDDAVPPRLTVEVVHADGASTVIDLDLTSPSRRATELPSSINVSASWDATAVSSDQLHVYRCPIVIQLGNHGPGVCETTIEFTSDARFSAEPALSSVDGGNQISAKHQYAGHLRTTRSAAIAMPVRDSITVEVRWEAIALDPTARGAIPSVVRLIADPAVRNRTDASSLIVVDEFLTTSLLPTRDIARTDLG